MACVVTRWLTYCRAGKGPRFAGDTVWAGLQYGQFMRSLRRSVALAGRGDRGSFGTHSFRRGAACALDERGVAPHVLKARGRWQSDAYRVYIAESTRGQSEGMAVYTAILKAVG